MGFCVLALPGPVVVAELHAPGGCSADLFVLAGNVSELKWITYAPSGSPLNITGATLLVREDENLVIGTVAKTDAKIGHDVRCSITWAGWAP